MAKYEEWPKMMYGPDGASKAFEKDDVIPKGWETHPSKVGAKPSQTKTEQKEQENNEPTPQEREDTIRSIRDAAAADGIDIQLADDASVEEINAAIDKLTKR